MIHLVLAVALVLAPVRARGESLYNISCASCHGLALQGGRDAPPLIGTSAADVDLMLQTGRMPAAAPGQQYEDTKPRFSQRDIFAIVNYVTSRGHGNPGLPHLAPGNAALGRALFAENCEQCHGVSAHGASVGYANLAPSLMRTNPEQIAEAVRSGPGEMPRFGPDVMTDSNVDDLTSFIGYLRHEKRSYNPGGLQLANVGPVAEGFVAWIFGLGALVIFVRAIGSND
ncbi:MAG: c-type cytochrome [Vulcanimicrobiaceae bacterium]|jgi:ubiquinol-cytochrome c reductase cytochrome c subunit